MIILALIILCATLLGLVWLVIASAQVRRLTKIWVDNVIKKHNWTE